MRENGVAKVLFTIGIIEMIVGFVLGIFVGVYFAASYEGFIWPYVLMVWLGSIVTGIILIGIAELIEILDSKLTRVTSRLDEIKYISGKVLEQLDKKE